MVKPDSIDLRERAVVAMADGESASIVAEGFGVAKSSVIKWHQRYHSTGSVAPDKKGWRRGHIFEPHRDFIQDAIARTPHMILHGLKDLLAERSGVSVSHNAVWLFLRREGLRFRKTLLGIEQARTDVARKRRRWKSFMHNLNPRHLVFSTKSG